MVAVGPSPTAHKGGGGGGGGGRYGSVMVKYHTFQTRGQGFEPLCKHFFPNFQGGLSPM